MTNHSEATPESDLAIDRTNIGDEELITTQENDFGVDIPPVPGRIIYVNQNATGNNDGSSWENAFTDLPSALEVAGSTNEVWVAAGTYLPTPDNNRDRAFVLRDGVRVYGGFAGGETERNQRNFLENRVVLSGDIGASDAQTDNSYNVVLIEDSELPTVLDGFTVADGQADGGSIFTTDAGGGINVSNSDDVNLSNLIVANNFTADDGGGIFQLGSNVNITNVAFLNNLADDTSINGRGGAIYSINSTGTVTNALFVNNRAYRGSAIELVSGDGLDITNSTFVGNVSETGTISNSSTPVNIENSIFELNRTTDNRIFDDFLGNITINNSIVQGGFDGAGENIIDADPLFADLSNNDFSLQQGSPAIDAGNNAAVEGLDNDLVGNPRIVNDTVDLGAYEFLTAEDLNNTPDPDDATLEGEPVYRFFIPDTGVHFYTADEAERDDLAETQPDYVLEGATYISAPPSDSLTGVAPIYRFLNTDTGIRIYTISEAERDSIEENLPNYESEGIAYYGYTEPQEGTVPVFRFYNPTIDAHFYTSSAVERDSVIENLPDYELESNGGIAFYVEPLVTTDNPDTQPPSDPVTETANLNLGEELGDILSNLLS